MRYPAFWQRRGLRSLLLWPLSLLVCVIAVRRRVRASARQREIELPRPVLVVGNLTVGGTGKTPVLIALAQALQAEGVAVGVVSRGYGARIGVEPRDVAEAASAAEVGDEPWLIHEATGVPVVVHPDRLRAAALLCARYPEIRLVLSDDGLQHHALPRRWNWVVLDARRGLGNRFCLPAGPLREPASGLDRAAVVLVNGAPDLASARALGGDRAQPVQFVLTGMKDLYTGRVWPLDEFLAGPGAEPLIALAAIGHPERFFAALTALGLTLETYALADHAPVPTGLRHHLRRSGQVVVMTEKDAAKWIVQRPGWHNQPGQVFAACGRIDLPAGLVASLIAELPGESN
ncbi:tetraacyldisaccharide 4'-kinase [Halothiobacillus sp. DCM-1]|uniref:tetraacyldisaccharide 4'-kinase n=1 Tax=Halothiobacillus sp. DCM-1 TaxID=3112558 RepID=UPI0032525746